MRWQVHVTQSAIWDLSDVANYIANTEKNKMKAFDLVDKAEETFSKLTEYPYSHQVISDSVLISWEIRYVRVEKYLAFYWIEENAKIIHILRFLYEKSNWKSILRSSIEPNID